MKPPVFDKVMIGDRLPPLQLPPIGRTTLARFAGASGDHNPIHIDLDFARRAGMPDVFAHGMLGMAWLGRQLTTWAPQFALRHLAVRFMGITHLGNAITCSATVIEKSTDGGECCVRLRLCAENQYGEAKIVGEALLSLPET